MLLKSDSDRVHVGKPAAHEGRRGRICGCGLTNLGCTAWRAHGLSQSTSLSVGQSRRCVFWARLQPCTRNLSCPVCLEESNY